MTLIEFKDYIKRKLGEPVINVEIDDLQLDDCISESVAKFIEGHYDGTDIAYIKYTFTKDTAEFTLDQNIQSVTGILTENDLLISDEPLLLKPFVLSDFDSGDTIDLTSVEIFKQRIQSIENYFRNDVVFDFNSTTKKLNLAVSYSKDQNVILKVFKSELDNTEIYDNLWLKKYATALAKIQWGSNISKFSGATLPGGVSLNGEAIKSDGQEEKSTLDTELEEIYTAPPDFFIG